MSQDGLPQNLQNLLGVGGGGGGDDEERRRRAAAAAQAQQRALAQQQQRAAQRQSKTVTMMELIGVLRESGTVDAHKVTQMEQWAQEARVRPELGATLAQRCQELLTKPVFMRTYQTAMSNRQRAHGAPAQAHAHARAAAAHAQPRRAAGPAPIKQEPDEQWASGRGGGAAAGARRGRPATGKRKRAPGGAGGAGKRARGDGPAEPPQQGDVFTQLSDVTTGMNVGRRDDDDDDGDVHDGVTLAQEDAANVINNQALIHVMSNVVRRKGVLNIQSTSVHMIATAAGRYMRTLLERVVSASHHRMELAKRKHQIRVTGDARRTVLRMQRREEEARKRREAKERELLMRAAADKKMAKGASAHMKMRVEQLREEEEARQSLRGADETLRKELGARQRDWMKAAKEGGSAGASASSGGAPTAAPSSLATLPPVGSFLPRTAVLTREERLKQRKVTLDDLLAVLHKAPYLASPELRYALLNRRDNPPSE